MKIAQVRRFALSLPEVTEEPHFEKSSFRIRGKIFATVPTGGTHLHVFVDDPQRDLMVSAAPQAYEKLWWGKKVVGLRVTLSRARAQDVEELLRSAWERKAPKRYPLGKETKCAPRRGARGHLPVAGEKTSRRRGRFGD